MSAQCTTNLNYPQGLTFTHPSQGGAAWEAQRINRAQRGDLEAFNDLVLIYQDRVFQQAYWMLGEEEAAEDAAQEAFILAFRKINTFHEGSFRAWVMTITTHYCLDQIRSAKRHPQLPLEMTNADGEESEPSWCVDPAEGPEQAVERIQTERFIADAIRHLSPEYRAALILVDLQEMDYHEAAAALSIPLGTVKSRLARARLQLRAGLKSFEPAARRLEESLYPY